MLQLQRASAGSGKTFTLAKKFIWFLIAIKDKDNSGRWRLRTPREIADGLRRILAITFTNKATNEMKQRIVEKLADLSRADSEYPLSDQQRKEINYLDDFAEQLGVDYREIGRVAGEALSVLLNEYSDFKVSTIDSFFQTVLRTFAYESNLNDTYQVEIDTDYLSAAAVNATLSELDSTDLPSVARFWVKTLMESESANGSKHWNVFQKSNSKESLYSSLLFSVKQLEKEDFKQVREQLDAYFDNPEIPDPLRVAYTRAVDRIVRPLEESLAEAKKAAAKLRRLFAKHGLDPKEVGIRFLVNHLNKIPGFALDTPSKDLLKPLDLEGKTTVYKTSGKAKKSVVSTPDDALILETALQMDTAYSRFVELRNTSDWLHWKVYAPNIPYLGLIGISRLMIKEYLDANNTIQLAETNSMLRRIIGDDDAPFIYERLGAHLNHFLIDEFQDTSRLQWENLLPLLRESNGRGEDNLIIGDAKQSIYRFRNADPSLITEAVPSEFPDRKDAGMSLAENTNWRSRRTIVEFNNLFFHLLMQRVADLSDEVRGTSPFPPTVDFRNLYSNVAQYPSKRERSGYIEVNFIEAPETRVDPKGRIRKLEPNEKTEFLHKEALSRVGPLIRSLIERGYRQSDIAILVRKNDLAKQVIEALIEYNATLPAAERIEFISEESLLVSSSEAVGIIISILSKMAEGSQSTNPSQSPASAAPASPVSPSTEISKVSPAGGFSSGDEGLSSGEAKNHNPRWSEIQCDFIFYAMRNPCRSAAEQVRGFLADDTHTDAVSAMLRSMQTVALPALVEAITENFVPEDLRRSQAVFIAALQDLVLEFTESHPADLSSFIDWWRSKGITKSISSPEGTDAIQIMTIHKSKGLEFKCVILPFDNASIIPKNKSEWKWVRPAERFLSLGFPPYLPVSTTSALKETEHSDVYFRFFDLSSMDMLNAFYVAFTRAVDNLFIFTAKPSTPKTSSSTSKECSASEDLEYNAVAGLSEVKPKVSKKRSSKEKSSKKKASTLGGCLSEFFTEDEDSLFTREALECSGLDDEALSLLLPEDLIEWDENHTRLTIGTPVTPPCPQTLTGNAGAPARPKPSTLNPQPPTLNQDKTRIIDIYHVDSSPSVLQYVEAPDVDADTATQMPEAEDTDPRSEGNILHSILSMVKTPADLHRAVLWHKMRGYITSEQAAEYEAFLEEAISRKEVRDWYSGRWRVLNERDMLYPGKKNRRPDRVLIAPDKKSGIIIDYKFGDIPKSLTSPDDGMSSVETIAESADPNLKEKAVINPKPSTLNRHQEQVKGYIQGFREILHIHNVIGYIWYVRHHRLVPVYPD